MRERLQARLRRGPRGGGAGLMQREGLPDCRIQGRAVRPETVTWGSCTPVQFATLAQLDMTQQRITPPRSDPHVMVSL